MVLVNPMPPKRKIDAKPASSPDKAAVYEPLSALNQHFEELLATCQASIEETRAWVNFEATETLHDCEERDRAHFGRIRHGFEKKYEDPQDVLLRAERMQKQTAESTRKKR